MAIFPPFAVASMVDMWIHRVLTMDEMLGQMDDPPRDTNTYHIAMPIHTPCIQQIPNLDATTWKIKMMIGNGYYDALLFNTLIYRLTLA